MGFSLGTGVDMMQGGDSDGTWHLIEDGMRSVSLLGNPPSRLADPLAGRTAAMIGHIPWVGRYVRSLPGVGTGAKRLREFAKQKFTTRKDEGSGKRDLFYYLVGPVHTTSRFSFFP